MLRCAGVCRGGDYGHRRLRLLASQTQPEDPIWPLFSSESSSSLTSSSGQRSISRQPGQGWGWYGMSNKVWLPRAGWGVCGGTRAPALESHWVGAGCCTGIAGVGRKTSCPWAQSWEDLYQTSHRKVSSRKLQICPDGTHRSVWGHRPQAWPRLRARGKASRS